MWGRYLMNHYDSYFTWEGKFVFLDQVNGAEFFVLVLHPDLAHRKRIHFEFCKFRNDFKSLDPQFRQILSILVYNFVDNRFVSFTSINNTETQPNYRDFQRFSPRMSEVFKIDAGGVFAPMFEQRNQMNKTFWSQRLKRDSFIQLGRNV